MDKGFLAVSQMILYIFCIRKNCRIKMTKHGETKYRIRNWPEYNRALVNSSPYVSRFLQRSLHLFLFDYGNIKINIKKRKLIYYVVIKSITFTRIK